MHRLLSALSALRLGVGATAQGRCTALQALRRWGAAAQRPCAPCGNVRPVALRLALLPLYLIASVLSKRCHA
ncbi:hypothetical protein [Roseiflexus sp.]